MTTPLRRPCLRCDRTMRPSGLRHAGRGLCGACWTWAKYHGRLDEYPRTRRKHTDTGRLLQRFDTCKAEHPKWSGRRIAEDLNVPYTALRKALYRARRTTQQVRRIV